jgi:hypothetical protein
MNSYDKYIETIRASSYLIGVDEAGAPPLRNITLLALLSETNCLTNNDGIPIPQREIDEINSIAVVWYHNEDDEKHIHQVYNFNTGEIYWDFDPIGNMDWTDNDDKLVGSLIKWGGLE